MAGDPDALRNHPRQIIQKPIGGSRNEAPPDTDHFPPVKKTYSRIPGAHQPMNTLGKADTDHGMSRSDSVGTRAFIRSKTAGSLGLGRDDSRHAMKTNGVGSEQRLASARESVIGPPLRVSSSRASTHSKDNPIRLDETPACYDIPDDFTQDDFNQSIQNRSKTSAELKRPPASTFDEFYKQLAKQSPPPSPPGVLSIFGSVVNSVKGIFSSPQTLHPMEDIDVELQCSGPDEVDVFDIRGAFKDKEKGPVSAILYPSEDEDVFRLGKSVKRKKKEEEPWRERQLTFFVSGFWLGADRLHEIPEGCYIRFRDSSEFNIIFTFDGVTQTFPVQDSDIRLLCFGEAEMMGAAFLDIYPRNMLSFAAPLAPSGFALGLIPERCTNIRLFLDLTPKRTKDNPDAMADFKLCCSRLSVNKFERDKEEYHVSRPTDFFDSNSRPGVPAPYAAIRRPNLRQRSSSSVYSEHRYTEPRKSRLTPSKSGASDDVQIMAQPRIPTLGELLFIYPEGSPDAIHMTTVELARLQPGVYLNDNLIDFSLRWVYDSVLTKEQKEKTFVFSSFFYRQYCTGATGYETVKSWTRDVDIFSKEYLLVPINEALHWYLALIFNPGACIGKALENKRADEQDSQQDMFAGELTEVKEGEDDFTVMEEADPDKFSKTYILIVDSLFTNRTPTMQRLKSYLKHEAADKLGLALDPTRMTGQSVKGAPRQDNLTDCGCFLLEYAEQIMRHLDTIGRELIEQRHAWFTLEHAKGRRERMKSLMADLAEDYKARHPDMHHVIDLGNSSDVEEIL